MHIKISRTNLLTILTRASQFSESRGTVAVLGYALFTTTETGITSTATTLEQQITDTIDCEVISAGSVLVPVSQVLDITKRLPKDATVDIKATEKRLTIKSGSYQSHVSLMDTADFPAISAQDYPCSFTVPASVLRRCFDRVAFAISTEETRYYLNGVYIHTDGGKLKFCATDGHRLALTRIVQPEMTGEFSEGVIIPRKLVTDISRILDGDAPVTVRISQSRVMFDFGYCRVEGKLVEGTFPEYDRVIPRHNENTVTIPSRVMSDTVMRVATVNPLKSKPVKIEITEGSVNISCSHEGNEASDVISTEYENNPLTIGFQARYIADVLAGFVGDSVWMFADSSAPAVIRDTGDEDVLCVLMPMRI